MRPSRGRLAPLLSRQMHPWLHRVLRVLPWASLLLVLLTALYLVVSVEQDTTQLSRHALWVFVSATVALVLLAALIVGRLLKLRHRIQANEPGARLTARLVKIFSALALPPVVVLYLFALQFLSETVEGWLDVQTEQALSESIELGQMFLDFRTREVSASLERIVADIELNAPENWDDALFEYVRTSGPTELAVINAAGQAQASVNLDPRALAPNLPDPFALSQVVDNETYAAAEPSESGLVIRVLRQLPRQRLGQSPMIVQAIYPLPQAFSGMAENIEQAYYRYQNVAFLRERLEQSLVLILSLVLLLTALLAILLAFNAARRVTQPVKELALATQELAAGRFPKALKSTAPDELGFLVESFNTMTHELAQSRQALEAQRRYLEVVLSRLSAGVVAVDQRGQITALNPSACEILKLNRDDDQNKSIREVVLAHPQLSPLFDLITQRLGAPSGEWRQEIQIGESPQASAGDDRPLVLVCRGSDLPGDTGGHVVVFDDVTVLDQAQREAAWSEVARRLAHEVKNPLTPIQLAAERLEHKLGQRLGGDDAALLARATSTIGTQVDALRRLVDAFGDYAKPKPPKMEAIDAASAIQAVVDLYASAGEQATFELNVEPSLTLTADPSRLRQVFLNLIANAMEAQPNARATIEISAHRHPSRDGWVMLTVADDGPGFSDAIIARVFEPYITSKEGGTGLGLAIVRRIIEEHGGEIGVSNDPNGSLSGAVVRISLPSGG